MHVLESVNAAMPPTVAVAAPGDHGPTVTGVHGPGVRTPRAAVVRDAVMGLTRLLHSTNGVTLTNGIMSMMFAIGIPVIVVSADIQPLAQERVKKLGAMAFIKKPVNPDLIESVLKQYGIAL